MTPELLLMKVFSLFLLASLGASSPQHLRDVDNFNAFFTRQNDPIADPAPSCEVSCDLNTCGVGVCGGPSTVLKRRSFNDLGSLLDSFTSTNVSKVHATNPRELSKRIWRFDPASNDPVGDRLPTVGEVDRYLPTVFTGGESAYFGAPLRLTSEVDERAYSQQVQFGDQPFQIMTGGIHGCTTVALVSNRAVWMAHFWESYSHNADNEDTRPEEAPDFVDRVLKFIRGETVSSPAPSNYKPYITPTGPSPDADLFNGDDDETQLFISTPIADGQKLEYKQPKLKYTVRVGAIQTEFRRLLGKTPRMVRIPYKRLIFPKELALKNRSNRGMHLFQYDPNSDNNGKRSWRLFMEARYTVKNLP